MSKFDSLNKLTKSLDELKLKSSCIEERSEKSEPIKCFSSQPGEIVFAVQMAND
jgi:hypothetical protein